MKVYMQRLPELIETIVAEGKFVGARIVARREGVEPNNVVTDGPFAR